VEIFLPTQHNNKNNPEDMRSPQIINTSSHSPSFELPHELNDATAMKGRLKEAKSPHFMFHADSRLIS